MIVKICGIRTVADAEAVNAAGPDMAGFVFHSPSRRYVSPREAGRLRGTIDPSILTVGVFVDEDPRTIARLVSDGTIGVVQLHGGEDPMYIHGLRAMVDAPIIRTFIPRTAADIDAAERSPADLVLLDAGRGSGRTFDWSLAEGLRRDYILSGGLGPDNVADAVSRLSPFGVDVSSGVETDGRKDPAKMASFVEAARSAVARRESRSPRAWTSRNRPRTGPSPSRAPPLS